MGGYRSIICSPPWALWEVFQEYAFKTRNFGAEAIADMQQTQYQIYTKLGWQVNVRTIRAWVSLGLIAVHRLDCQKLERRLNPAKYEKNVCLWAAVFHGLAPEAQISRPSGSGSTECDSSLPRAQARGARGPEQSFLLLPVSEPPVRRVVRDCATYNAARPGDGCPTRGQAPTGTTHPCRGSALAHWRIR